MHLSTFQLKGNEIRILASGTGNFCLFCFVFKYGADLSIKGFPITIKTKDELCCNEADVILVFVLYTCTK